MNIEDRRKEKLIAVKLGLAQRYESRAKLTGSTPRRQTLLHHAESYRQQAAELRTLIKK